MEHDVIVIGGGAAGLGAARAALAAGANPLLISDGPLGGDCTFTGCVPSKTLLSQSRAGGTFSSAMERVRSTVDQIAATETADVLRAEGAEVVEGRANFTRPTAIAVDGTSFTSPHIVVATGSSALIPPIDGLDTIDYLTNETLFSLDSLPARLGIVGGGAIGCEMALAFARFGSKVTIFEGASTVLPVEDPDASEVISQMLIALGVDIRSGAFVSSVSNAGETIDVAVADDVVEVDRLLIAAGRRPNTDGLGLDAIGVALDKRGHVVVDERLRSSVSGIRAAGDVTGLLPFTHAADEQGRMAVAHALGKGARWKYVTSATPWVTFTSPEVAQVGVRELEAPANSRVAYLPMNHVDRAITDGRTEGFIKLIAGPKKLTRGLFGGELIGATIVAERAGEMIHAPTLAIRLGMFVGRLAQVTTAYPTWSTAVQQAAGQFFQPVNGLEARAPRTQSGRSGR